MSNDKIVQLKSYDENTGQEIGNVLPITNSEAVKVENDKNLKEKLTEITNKIDQTNASLDKIENRISYSVKDFGAKGDGITDDYKAIQDTLNYVNTLGGGNVLIPKSASDYLISDNLYIYSNTTLQFDGSFIKLTKKTTTGAVITNNSEGEKTENVKIINALVDGNNILGQNGIGFGINCENITIINPCVKNCKRDASIGGGRAVTFQLGTKKTFVSDLIAENCTTAYDCHGILDNPSIDNFVTNITAINCEEILSFYDLNDIGSRNINAINCIINNITAKNCGTLEGGLIILERASNIKINNIICLNDEDYGQIGGIVRGKGYDCQFDNITFSGNLKAIINGKGATNIKPVTSNSNCPLENIKMTNVITKGNVDYGIISATGNSNILKDITLTGECEQITKLFDDLAKVKTTVYVSLKNKLLNKTRTGLANLLTVYADIDFSKAENEIEYVFKKIADFTFSKGTKGAIIGTTENIDIVLRRNNLDMLHLTEDGVLIEHSNWDGRHLMMGNWHFWIDTNGDLRYANKKPTSPLFGRKVLTE